MIQAISTSLTDKYKRWKKEVVVGILCAASFLVGVVYTFGGGLFILDIVDHITVQYGLLIVGLIETLVIAWIFGADKMRSFIDSRSDWKTGKWFTMIIKIIAPLIIGLMLVYQFVSDIRMPYEGYPIWMLVTFGWAILVLLLSASVIYSLTASRKRI